MITNPKSYDDLARDVIRDYVRSAVIIDDQWPEPGVGESLAEEPPDESGLVDDEIPEVAIGRVDDSEDLAPTRPADNEQDALLLIDLQQSLLTEGLIACGFRYTHKVRDKAIELARRADIVVLDWHLTGDDGTDALEILRELLGNELRFICIFTGHGSVAEVRQTLNDQLGKVTPDSGLADLCIGNLVIAIRNKKGIDQETPNFTVGPGQLLSAVFRGLASKYNGLVQLAMLELTQQHRRQLPEILGRIDDSVDTAVLLEAGDELSPVGQSGAFLGILVDEWRAHLEQEHSKLRVLGLMGRKLFGARLAARLRNLSDDDMKNALQHAGINEGSAKAFAKKSKESGHEKLREWLTGGCEGAVPDPQGGPFKEGKRLSVGWGALQALSGGAKQDASAPLLRLDALFHQQFELPERLTQGTIVAVRPGTAARESVEDYCLCITPLCDADRPESFAHLFTFLRTNAVSPERIFDPKKRRLACYCVVERKGSGVFCLEVLLKQRIVLEVLHHVFDSDGIVRGKLTVGSSTAGGVDDADAACIRLYRVAQLRSEHAFSIAAAAAADSARVGVNRGELIRSRFS